MYKYLLAFIVISFSLKVSFCQELPSAIDIRTNGTKVTHAISWTKLDTLGVVMHQATFNEFDGVVAWEKVMDKEGNMKGETFYFPSGKKYKLYTYEDGYRNGPYEVYAPNGLISQRGSMKDGKKHGKVLMFLEGQPWKTEIYKLGILVQEKKKKGGKR